MRQFVVFDSARCRLDEPGYPRQDLFCPRRGMENTFFDPRRGAENGLLIREEARKSAKNIFPIRGRLGMSFFLSSKVATGLCLSHFAWLSPVVNET